MAAPPSPADRGLPRRRQQADLVADTQSTATTYPHIGLNAATTRHYRVSAINTVGTSDPSGSDDATTEANTVTATVNQVPDWALKPADIDAGGQFRLMFVTSTNRDATSTDIADYNTFVRTRATAGVTAIQTYANDFTALVSTETVNARTNTLTRDTDTDAPIYWVRSGTVFASDRVADDYADFYDGSWNTFIGRTESGGLTGLLSPFWTGTNTDGTTHATEFMGATGNIANIIYWIVSSQSTVLAVSEESFRTYRIGALSPVFQVAGTATNTAPTAADNTVTTVEDTDYTFEADDFGFVDADTGDMLESVLIVTMPTEGTLRLNGTAVMASRVVTRTQIDNGNLKFDPADDANGDPYATFTFRVNDGTDDSASAYTMTIDVTAANDPATGEPTISGTARVGRTLAVSTAGIMDVDGLPSTFSYQWLRKAGATTTSISGANSRTYNLQAADLGNKVAVRVSFTDDDGSPEMRTSGDYPTSGTVQANNILVSNTGQTTT